MITFTRLLLPLLLPLLLLSAGFSASAKDKDSLYQSLGGQKGIMAFVSDTIDQSLADKRIKHTFKNTKDIPLVKQRITNQICELSGGPCTYKGADMDKAHSGLGINSKMFNILVEHLQAAMRKQKISHRSQYKLIALLAPMHGDVIETKKKVAERQKARRERMRKLMEEEEDGS